MSLMRRTCYVLLCVLLASVSRAQNSADVAAKLLDHLTGSWMLQGTIAGQQTTHDIEARWVLNGEYVQLHEISREKNASGRAAYEAIVYLSWDVRLQQYTCLWLDSTAGGGLSADGMAHGSLAGDSIPLLFTTSPTDQIRTTFSYNKTADTWQWLIDNVEKGQAQHFANVTLTRAK